MCIQCLAFLNQRESGEIWNSFIRVSQGSCMSETFHVASHEYSSALNYKGL